VGLTEHLKIGKGAIALARAAIMNDVEPGTVVMGEPARPHRQNLRILAAREKLPDALVEVRKLREDLKKALDRIEQLEAGGGISPKTS
jgi:UDP-3-O-[3-hydroxymyristoyl] glucosamine N-acyltransferase